MSRHRTPTRAAAALTVVLASLALSACGTTATLSAIGQPSLSLAAPLTAVACTTTGACVSVGASGGVSVPSAAGQVRNHRGIWSALNVPPASVGSFSTGTCGSSTCLFGGTQATGELLWSVDADTGAVTALNGTSSGVEVRSLSCSSDTACAILDQTAANAVRLSFSHDGGDSWGAAQTLPWAQGAQVVLDCPAANICLVAVSAHGTARLRETSDAGATWRVIPTPSTWSSIRALNCSTTCVALVSDAAGSAIATQTPSTWSQVPLSFDASDLSCTSGVCVAVGDQSDQSAAMALAKTSARPVRLTYVPTALDAVACAPSVCVAIGVSTVVALRP